MLIQFFIFPRYQPDYSSITAATQLYPTPDESHKFSLSGMLRHSLTPLHNEATPLSATVAKLAVCIFGTYGKHLFSKSDLDLLCFCTLLHSLELQIYQFTVTELTVCLLYGGKEKALLTLQSDLQSFHFITFSLITNFWITTSHLKHVRDIMKFKNFLHCHDVDAMCKQAIVCKLRTLIIIIWQLVILLR